MEDIEKYGFVYIWYDKKYKRYYIGSHWGTTEDGYICSSKWMLNSRKRRTDDFKRRILKIVTDRKTLLDEEYDWLQLIPHEQLGKGYYNLTNHHNRHWSTDPIRSKSVGEKISKANKGKSWNKGRSHWNKGRSPSLETRKKISDTLKGRPIGYIRTEDTRKKISENNKRAQREHKIGMYGKKHSTYTIQKMKENNAMKNPTHIQKIIDAKKGIRWLRMGESRKMAVPGTEKYATLVDGGYSEISSNV